MNEENNGQAVENTEAQVSELDLLKQRARMMNIEFSNNIGIDSLRARVDARIDEDTASATHNDNDDDDTIDGNVPDPFSGSEEVAAAPVKKPVAAVKEKKMSLRAFMHKTQMKLVRCRITNMDPKKKDLHGEIFTVANSHLGTVRKFIPYGEVSDNGYHIPYCILKQLQARRFLSIRTPKDSKGQIQVKQSWAKEFAIEILDPLTKDELHDLATAQQASGSVGSEA